jgi:hypothetical protein
MRTKGSCRFAAYYKIETYDERRCCWRPLQKAFPTYSEADQARPSGKTRIMKCDGKNFEEVTA